MMTEESETPPEGGSQPDPSDALAARRARRTGDPAVLRRAEAAEAVARNLETHLAALEQRINEIGRERERVSQQLAERESDVRGVKQREYTEQQLRVEAEERSERLQREMRAQIQELSGRLEQTEHQVRELSAELAQLRERDARLTPIVRELMDVAAGLRASFERELTALRDELQQQVVWERETYVRELTAMEARMEDLRFELTRTAAELRAQLSAEPLDPALLQHTTEPDSEREAAHRRELADALVAAVDRLRARVAEVKQAEAAEEAGAAEEAEAAEPTEAVELVEAVEGAEAVELVEAVEGAEAAEGAEVAAEADATIEGKPAVEVAREADSAGTAADIEDVTPEEPPAAEIPIAEPHVEWSQVAEVHVAEQTIEESLSPVPPVAEPPVEQQPVEQPPAVESSAEPQPSVEQQPLAEAPAVEEASRAEGLAAPIPPSDRFAPPEPAIPGLGPSAAVGMKAVTSEPIALQSRLLTVPQKRISWLAPAIRWLASHRDPKLAAELVIELIPAQRELVDAPLSYEIKIGELGTFYVTLEPGQATISREPRGAVDFSLEGPVAAFSELAAGGTSRRHPGLRIRKGRRSARRFLKSRRRPIALADLAAANVDIWPGLLLLAMAAAIDPSWTSGRRFELAFEIQDTAGIIIYVRVCDGEAVQVSRTAVGQPVATIALSGHALICLLAGTQPPPEHSTLVTGDVTSVDMFLQWTARAQGLSV